MKNQSINCLKCTYYYVTWDRDFPNGCRAYGLKSAARPSLTVMKSSGEACMKYTSKR
ncbi:uracil-DNA glycosylase [Bacillus sp. V2I10]|uniref:uracil-DNA glycosylase n=1 Tax=Bacillus sp. V2I10 TaxID=3042276 RepID=UPI0027806DE0|nr:uracil-DNA glycosylase [Bacillus sp. V2I10]MDQ0856989.1 putative secreted Zn-dependent protease [Bacillus sp. V2I10]